MVQKSGRASLVLAAPMVLAAVIFLIYPVFHGLLHSLFDFQDGRAAWLHFMGYRLALQDRALRYSLVVTVLWSTGIVALTLIISVTLASRMALGGKARRILYTVLLLPWAIPVYIAVPLWRAMLYGNGGESLVTWITGFRIPMMEDPAAGFFSAMAVSVWMQIPFTVFICYSHLKRLGKEMIDAAALEGCGVHEVIRWIFIPQLRTPLLMLAFLNGIGSFKEFTSIYLMTAGGPPLVSGITDRYIIGATTTIGVFLYQVFQGMHHYALTASFGVIMAAGVAILVVLWRTAKRRHAEGRIFRMRLIAAAVHFLPLGPWSWAFGAAYLAASRNRKLFLAVCCVHAACTVYWIAAFGVLEGLNPALILAAGISLDQLSHRDSIQVITPWRARISLLLHHGLFSLSSSLLVISSVLLIYMLVWLSISGANIVTVTGFLPPFASLETFRRTLSSPNVWRSFGNTVLIASGTAVLLPLIVLPAAAALQERGKHSGDRWITMLQLAGTAGGIHTLIPLFFLLSPVGLLDTRTAVILVYTSGSIPTALMVAVAYYEHIPYSLHESARLDGATTAQRLRYIFVPLSIPAAATCALVGFVSGWNGFLVPLLFIRSEGLYPISLQLHRYVGGAASAQADWSSFAVLSMVNLLLVVLMLSRLKGPLGKTALQDYSE